MRLLRIWMSLTIFVLALSLTSAQTTQTPDEVCDAAEPAELTDMQFEAAEEVLEEGIDYHAVFCTDAGAIYIDLFEAQTPITVNNFVFLAEQNYYDSTTFHRVIQNFMAQAGDPTATGRGGPGYQFEDEFVDSLTFDKPGLLAMANAGPATNGSQFFITTVPTPHLDGAHTIFGEVLKGQGNVLSLQIRDPQSPTGPGSMLNTIVIVTDPSTVSAEISQADVVNAFEDFNEGLPAQLPLDEERSGLYTAEEVVETVPEEFQEAFATFVDTHGLQYRYAEHIVNAECNTQVFFSSLSYTIDAFDNADDASAALEDDFINDLATSNGFEETEDNLYSQNAATCADGEGVYGMYIFTIGKYLITAETHVPIEIIEQVDLETLLAGGDITGPFDAILYDVFAAEETTE